MSQFKINQSAGWSGQTQRYGPKQEKAANQ